jgi:hypothetical protein
MTNAKPQQRRGYPEQKTGGAIIEGAPKQSNVINNYKPGSAPYSRWFDGFDHLAAKANTSSTAPLLFPPSPVV